MAEYHRREIAPLVRDALDALPVVVVTGLRGAGKSTMLARDPALRGRRIVDLENPEVRDEVARRPSALVAQEDLLSVDEVQLVPALLRTIRQRVDGDRSPGRFLLSASVRTRQLERFLDALGDRAYPVTLHPLSRREIHDWTAEPPFLVRFLEDRSLPRVIRVEPLSDAELSGGGLPSIALAGERGWASWLAHFEKTIAGEDGTDPRRQSQRLREILHVAAGRTGEILNCSALARVAAERPAAVSRAVERLEQAFLVERLPAFLGTDAVRVTKTPRLYLADSGLAARLTPGSDNGAYRDAWLRTHVLRNLAAILGARLPRPELAFWSRQGRRKVDFVVTRGRQRLAIEVTSATRVRDEDLSGLLACLTSTPEIDLGIFAYNGEEAAELHRSVYAIPLGLLLS